ncbi:3D domain-containing protein [Paenibacillus ginsengarvi]|uniref:FMN-binding protein n=1 Tax=Paenibacillus ginsengarvi TaxID=400777 RepID=A0A3B0AUQ3_9BACL|nr:3D domain-containing protein [Paenibacillus ginsengarvi]RKN64320.1 FMN-binding protein [Paenibacillus ginsengarvi]
MNLHKAWKRTWLTGGFALILLSGTVVTAAGRPMDPILLQPASPLVSSADASLPANSDFSAYKTELLHNHLFAAQLLTAPSKPVALTSHLMATVTSLFQAEPPQLQMVPLEADLAVMPLAYTLAMPEKTAAAVLNPQPAAAQPAVEPQAQALPASQTNKTAAVQKEAIAAKTMKKASAAESAKEADAKNKVTTVTGATITPKKTIKAVASAYTASAEENGGYAGKDYFGNSLKVGSIAVDPDVIPLGSTVYVTGYTYNGLPTGGMMAKAVDIGGAIDGNRVDLFVPDSPEKAKHFGYQNVTLYVVD